MERDDRDAGEKGGGGGGECLRHYGTSAELRRLRFTDGNYKVSPQAKFPRPVLLAKCASVCARYLQLSLRTASKPGTFRVIKSSQNCEKRRLTPSHLSVRMEKLVPH